MSTFGTTIAPHFWRNPIRYCRWAAHEKPALFFSVVIGTAGPVLLVAGAPIKRKYGPTPAPQVPLTYPGMRWEFDLTAVPKGPRKILDGYNDP